FAIKEPRGARRLSAKQAAFEWMRKILQGEVSPQALAGELGELSDLNELVAVVTEGRLSDRNRALTVLARKKGVSIADVCEFLDLSKVSVLIFDFSTYKLRVCGIGGNPAKCGITVERDLFSPRVGWAYRPTQSLVIRAGFSRNVQNDNAGNILVLAFPSLISITQSPANSFSSVGSFSEGAPVVPQVDLKSGSVSLPAGASVCTLPGHYRRGHITSYNVTVQKLLAHSFSAQVGYVGNRQIDLVRSQNLNYGLIGGGLNSQPYFKLAAISGSVSV